MQGFGFFGRFSGFFFLFKKVIFVLFCKKEGFFQVF